MIELTEEPDGGVSGRSVSRIVLARLETTSRCFAKDLAGP